MLFNKIPKAIFSNVRGKKEKENYHGKCGFKSHRNRIDIASANISKLHEHKR